MPKESSEKRQPTKGTKGNLGQKKAEREEAADKDFSHMGADKKAQTSKQNKTG